MKLALVSTFIEPSTPPLGIGYLAAYLKKYSKFNDTFIVDANYDDIMGKIDEIKPDLVGISAMTIYYSEAIKIAKKIKAKYNIPVIIGGNHISTLPLSLDESFDIGVVGEAEDTVKELVDMFIEKGKFIIEDLKKVLGICYHEDGDVKVTMKRPLIKDIDIIPIIDYNLFDKRYFEKRRQFGTGTYEVMFGIMSARGCPYKCRFCSPANMWGYKVRKHTIARAVEEIRIGVEKFNATHILIHDDLVTLSKDRMRELYETLKASGLLDKVTLALNTRANLIDDEMCDILKKLKVVITSLGFESGNDEMLAYLKAESLKVEQSKQAMLCLERNKIPYMGSFIFANPNETIDQMKDTLKLMKFAYKHGSTFLYPFMMKPYPGTPVWDVAIELGAVSNDMDWELLTTFIEDVNEQNRPMTLRKDIKVKDFKKVFDKAVWITKKQSIRRLTKSFITHPIDTMREIGSPIKFIKQRYKLIKKGTLGALKEEASSA